MEIGRLCVKLAGRDAGKLCVVVDELDNNMVLIDGNVRRRKCNPLHLEPLDEVLKIKKAASHADVSTEFKKLKLDVWNTKPKKIGEKPTVKRKSADKVKPAKVEKPKAEKTEKKVKKAEKKKE
jgi:large subunit ribosomal protein L14e